MSLFPVLELRLTSKHETYQNLNIEAVYNTESNVQFKESTLISQCLLGLMLFQMNLHGLPVVPVGSSFWISGVLRLPVLFWILCSPLCDLLAMASRPRSRSRERLLSMAVMSELHRLPQSERQLIQKLKATISEIQELTKLSGFTRVLSDIAQQALDIPTPDGQSSAFILKGELQQISNQIVELNDSLNATMHGHLEDMEASFKSLTTTPDGSPFEMFSRAVDFTSRLGFFFKQRGKDRFLSPTAQAVRRC